MKPITDDVVFSILKGMEKRERRLKGIQKMTDPALPARILGPIGNKRVISLEVARQARRTVNGVLYFMAKN